VECGNSDIFGESAEYGDFYGGAVEVLFFENTVCSWKMTRLIALDKRKYC